EEVTELYEENLHLYEHSYLAANKLYGEIQEHLQPDRLSLSEKTRQSFQEKLSQLQTGIQANSYEKNSRSFEELSHLKDAIHQHHKAFEEKALQYEQLGRMMESQRTKFWKEDLEKLRSDLHKSIEQLQEESIPSAEDSLSEEVILSTQTLKSGKLDELSGKTKHKSFLNRIRDIRGDLVSYQTFEKLEKDILKRRRLILGGQIAAGLLILLALLFSIRILPQQIAAQKENQLWQRALQTNSYLVYQEYLDTYPEGTHLEEAKDLQKGVAEVDSLSFTDSFGRELLYFGKMDEGFPQGEGKAEYVDGSYYEGSLKQGLPYGPGKMVYVDGATYTGDWRKGQREGEGIQEFANGQNYEGNWKADVFQGQGTYTYADNHYYRGNWVNGKKSGKGKLYLPQGEKYEGEWKDGKRHGRGEQTYKDKSAYLGEWKEDKRSGKGMLSYPSTLYYTGVWKDDQLDGPGSLSWKSGGSFEGNWTKGKIKGKGTFLDRFRAEYTGYWEEKNDTIYFRETSEGANVKGRFNQGLFLTY
ncbi:MAG: hypothetical protein AAGC85_24185, partial [Bacteroidota bacterium]